MKRENNVDVKERERDYTKRENNNEHVLGCIERGGCLWKKILICAHHIPFKGTPKQWEKGRSYS